MKPHRQNPREHSVVTAVWKLTPTIIQILDKSVGASPMVAAFPRLIWRKPVLRLPETGWQVSTVFT